VSEVTYDFSGKNFAVTGASSGIGRRVALELAEAGARVLAVARRITELEMLRAESALIFPGACDVLDYDSLEKTLTLFIAAHGKLHGGVHAAGITAFTPLRAYDEATAKSVVDVSFWAGVKFVQLCAKTAAAAPGSSYVLFSSASGHRGEKGMFAYSAGKAALRIAVKSLAKELSAKKHRVNTVSPGFIRTNMTDGSFVSEDLLNKYLLGLGEPADVSGAVLFLLSERAAWITGTDMLVDGGYLSS
jgi:NAD(P)-dependent dehydrogenase (short-subunit alcohol dehydrogenase family)